MRVRSAEVSQSAVVVELQTCSRLPKLGSSLLCSWSRSCKNRFKLLHPLLVNFIMDVAGHIPVLIQSQLCGAIGGGG